jgi:Leucine-rich repeat (LRR) protein
VVPFQQKYHPPLFSTLPPKEQAVLEWFPQVYIPFEEWEEYECRGFSVISYFIEDGHVRKLNLQQNDPLKHLEFPQCFQDLTHLQELGIYCCVCDSTNLGDLPQLKSIHFCDCRINQLSEKFATIETLQKIEFDYDTSLSLIPSWFVNFKQLEALCFHFVSHIDFPVMFLKNYPKLQQLEIFFNKNDDISLVFQNLPHLRELTVYGKEFITIPLSLTQLSLEHLTLSSTSIQTLPAEWGKLQNLRSLKIKNAPLTPLELQKIRHLHAIQELTIQEIGDLGDISWIGELTNLQRLILTDNKIQNIPSVLNQLRYLVHLDLSRNKLGQFPPILLEIETSETICLVGNKITKIPDEIIHLRKLKELHLEDNLLTELPTNIVNLMELHILGISMNKLPLFPRLPPNLEALDFSYNKFQAIPSEQLNFPLLKVLDLRGNKINQLPVNFGSLHELRELDVSENPFTSVPESLRSLKNLKILNISSCNCNEVPAWINELTSLEQLYLERNNLVSLHPNLCTLPNLKRLHLSENHLQILPPNINQLPQLAQLLLDHNEIEQLPIQILDLPLLMWLELDGNNRLSNVEILLNHSSIYLNPKKLIEDFLDRRNN